MSTDAAAVVRPGPGDRPVAGNRRRTAGEPRRQGGGEGPIPLLESLERAPFTSEGQALVRRAAISLAALPRTGADTLCRLALLTQEHGLVEESLQVLSRLVREHPATPRGWQLLGETLLLLDRGKELERFRGMARAHGMEELLPAPVGGQGEVGRRKTDDPAAAGGDGAAAASGAGRDAMDQVTAPFAELRREEERLRHYLDLFQGREDAHARQWVDRQEDRSGYVPVSSPLDMEALRQHLGGRQTLGIYLLDSSDQVRTGVIDADLVPRLRSAKARRQHRRDIGREGQYMHTRMARLAARLGLAVIAEFSGGKGFHFWFPVDAPVPARDMRLVLGEIAARLQQDLRCFELEVFPKQDRRTGKGFGNLVKLPLGVHRKSGKPSWFLLARDRGLDAQLHWLGTVRPAPANRIQELAARASAARQAEIIPHPRLEREMREFPELIRLEERCALLAGIFAGLRQGRTLSMREEKILLGTLAHLPRGRLLLHHLFAHLPEYNRPLLDYRISRVRGTPLGCRRIHSLLEAGPDLPCDLEGKGTYVHPLLHLGQDAGDLPVAEKVENLRDAITQLKTALRTVERFLA